MIHSFLLILNQLKKDIAETQQSLAERDFTPGVQMPHLSVTGRVQLILRSLFFNLCKYTKSSNNSLNSNSNVTYKSTIFKRG